MIRKLRCRCGRRIIDNSETRTVSHEAPECEWFTGQVAKVATTGTTRVVEVLDMETGLPPRPRS